MLDALRRLNSLPGRSMVLFVADAGGRITGSVTDGDIRRALIAGVSLDSPVGLAAHGGFRFLREGEIDVRSLREYRNSGITLLPVLDRDNRLVELIDLSSCRSRLPLGAILMAGGKGERLRPATLTTPKPLLTIEGKAIIDYNIEALASCGIKDITVSTGYLADRMAEHFARPVAGVQVRLVREDFPMGTIGAVSLAGIPENGNTLVMNSDLITTISFEDMYLCHISADADITIATVPYQVSVPYAILSFEGERVSGIEEKPAYSYYANAGIYIISNKLLRKVSPDRRTDATELIERSIAEGARVVHYPIKGTWIDVGSPVDFRQASELMRHHNAMTSGI